MGNKYHPSDGLVIKYRDHRFREIWLYIPTTADRDIISEFGKLEPAQDYLPEFPRVSRFYYRLLVHEDFDFYFILESLKQWTS